MNTKSITRYLIISLIVFLTACSPLVVVQPTSTQPSPTSRLRPDRNDVATVVAGTVQAQAPTPAAVTATPVPATATPSGAAQPLATSSQGALICQEAAQYINDDGLDGSTYAPNTPFTKSWTLKNSGSCPWDSRTLVYYLSGTTMTQQPGYFIARQGEIVEPGQSVNISIGMTSPVENGNYTAYWGLKNAEGEVIPIQGGANGNSFYVKIRVNNGSSDSGEVTTTSIDIEPEQGSGSTCGASSTYLVHASISANGPTTAYYEISSTAGQISAGYFEDMNNGLPSPNVSGSLTFEQPETKTINLRFVGPYPYPDNISINLRVNGGEFQTTKLSCQR